MFPMVKLEIDLGDMKKRVIHAMSLYHQDLENSIEDEICKAIAETNIASIVKEQAKRAVVNHITEQVRKVSSEMTSNINLKDKIKQQIVEWAATEYGGLV